MISLATILDLVFLLQHKSNQYTKERWDVEINILVSLSWNILQGTAHLKEPSSHVMLSCNYNVYINMTLMSFPGSRKVFKGYKQTNNVMAAMKRQIKSGPGAKVSSGPSKTLRYSICLYR